MKRLTAFAMVILMCLALVACGGQTSADQPEENSTETTQMQQTSDVPQAQPTSSVPQVQDMVAFFDGIKPYYDRVVTQADGEKYRIMNYSLVLGSEPLIDQYIDSITSADYNLDLVETYVKEKEDVTHKYYYITYEGENKDCFGNVAYHINIAVSSYAYEGKAEVTCGFAQGFEYVDDGHRADFAKMDVKPAKTPKPTPTPTPEATPQPVTNTENQPAQTTTQPAQQAAVDKNASPIPDFTAFLNRRTSEDKDRYYGGTRKYYQKISLDTQDTVVQEVLNLLGQSRYQLQLIEKVQTDDRIDYNYRYTGNVSMDMIHSKNDDSRYYNLQFTVFNRTNNNGTYSIHFHYSPQFVEENVGYTVSVNISTGASGGGGGTIGPDGIFIPDHSKLQCLTCDGDGDCNSCGGSTYVGFGDARAKCGTCRGTGDCRTCGGSGTRD